MNLEHLGRLRIGLLLLALIGLVYLVMQTRAAPVPLSAWSPSRASGGVAVGPAAAPAPLAGRGLALPDDDVPRGNPLENPNTVMTQGYGVGSHAPAAIWGAVDLAIDGNGDGTADPEGTLGAPVYATHAGVVKLAENTFPAGNHIWVIGEHYKTGYSHLQRFAPGLQTGQRVVRGQLIGFVGSTGQSSGPHLDYQVWKDNVNVNPLDYGALDGTNQ